MQDERESEGNQDKRQKIKAGENFYEFRVLGAGGSIMIKS